MENLVTVLPNNEWWMARKRVYAQMVWCTNSFLGLHSHHDCDGKPPEKAVTSLMAKKTTHTNQENSALLIFHVDIKFWTNCIVTLEAQNPLLLISIALQLFRLHLSRAWNPNVISQFWNTKTVKSHLGVRRSFWRTSR